MDRSDIQRATAANIPDLRKDVAHPRWSSIRSTSSPAKESEKIVTVLSGCGRWSCGFA
jgi:hypothetical protein